jgi:hypothetical protein
MKLDLLTNANVVDDAIRFVSSKSKENLKGWIEQLLQVSLTEHRKYCIWRIFAPYFINVKHLSFDDSYDDIYQWLENCSKLIALDFDPETKINDSLNRAVSTGYLPISFDNPSREPRTLKSDNKGLYNIIKTNYLIYNNLPVHKWM